MRLPVIGVVFLFIVSILIDLYIYLDIKNVNKKRCWSIVYLIFTGLCLGLLIVTISLPRRNGDTDITTIMWLLFTYLSIYIGKLGYILCSVIGRLACRIFKKIPNSIPFKWFGVVVGLSLCGVMWIGTAYTRHRIEKIHVYIYSNKLPSSFDGYKIAQISDLHVGTWGNDTTFISQLVDSVNNLHPDIIVFTGDIVNRRTEELEPFVQVLSRLKAKDGVYSILGNHDYGDYVDWDTPRQREENNHKLALLQKDMGWHLLNNETAIINNGKDSILLIGVENWGDPPFPIYGDLDKALSSSRKETLNQNDKNFKILLSHNPEHWNREVSKKTNIDLTLSGHTHAMQMVLRLGDKKWSPAKYRYDQWGGLYNRNTPDGNNSQLYVNAGAGAVGMPARLLNAYPEITLLTLRKGKKPDSL